VVTDTRIAKAHRSLVTAEQALFGAWNHRELADVQISSLREKRTFCSPANLDDSAQCQVGHTFHLQSSAQSYLRFFHSLAF